PHGGERRVQFQFRGAFSDVAASPTRIRTYTITVRRAAQQHTVSFNSHGGTHVANRTVQNGRTIGALPTPTRTGYTFQGWFSAASGGTQVHANTVVTSNRTLHARWSANPVIHTITFDSMGVGSVGPIEVTHGAAMPAVVPPPKDGHSFVGWFTAAAGGVEVSVGTPIAANMHLFARWEPVGASGVSEAFDMNEHANDNVSESLEP
ncbi:MAG: InlB B-repeat-containing protein, partial [Coriobacteriia bacterium]|nr:InlB B-repeat-containing protein [Coriobacteriia bacterium]